MNITWPDFKYRSQALQNDFDRWLIHYNTERPHQGYRNLGKRPMDTVNAYLATVRKEA